MVVPTDRAGWERRIVEYEKVAAAGHNDDYYLDRTVDVEQLEGAIMDLRFLLALVPDSELQKPVSTPRSFD